MVTKWTGDFQAANKQPDEDVVFDVLCGDFNFDNCSPGMPIFIVYIYYYIIYLFFSKRILVIKVFFKDLCMFFYSCR